MQKIVWKDENFNGIKVVKLFEGLGSKEIRINLQKGHKIKEASRAWSHNSQMLGGKIEFSAGNNV